MTWVVHGGGTKSSEDVVDLTARARRLTLTTEELAERWGIHPESLERAVRSGASPGLLLPVVHTIDHDMPAYWGSKRR